MEYPTGIGTSDATSIHLLGHDLAGELIGHIGFGELALWLATQQRPTPQQVRVFEAVLVSLADHGFTPTAIAARLTLYSAPDALQGAMAAGLLGAARASSASQKTRVDFWQECWQPSRASSQRPMSNGTSLPAGQLPSSALRAASFQDWATRCIRPLTLVQP